MGVFDARVIERLPFVFKHLSGVAGDRERSERHNERRWCHDWQLFVSVEQSEGAVPTYCAMAAGRV